MALRNSAPSSAGRRPAQPVRPIPSRMLGSDLMHVKIRRQRYHNRFPKGAGELGW